MKQLDIEFATWGGKRDGAGRKRNSGRGSVPHRRRERHRAAHPVHVTLRARGGLPPFRERVLFRAVRDRIGAANRSRRLSDGFRVVEFTVQRDHLHLIIEARDASALARGVQGLAIRLARGINDVLRVRGHVWADRFHSRELKTPRAVRNALVYVLMNAKKHRATIAAIDALSSAPWFDGFSVPTPQPRDPPATRRAESWLARFGWRRRGLIHPDERPRAPD